MGDKKSNFRFIFDPRILDCLTPDLGFQQLPDKNGEFHSHSYVSQKMATVASFMQFFLMVKFITIVRPVRKVREGGTKIICWFVTIHQIFLNWRFHGAEIAAG
jgi:hypothetical protein